MGLSPSTHPHTRLISLRVLGPFLVPLVLLLQYAGSWYAIQITRVSKEAELERYLDDVGKLAADALEEAVLELEYALADSRLQHEFLAESDPTPPSAAAIYRELAARSEELTQPIERFAQHARLHKIVVLDTEGLVLLDTADPDRVLQSYEFWSIDHNEARRVLEGAAAASPTYAAEESHYQRFYVPLKSDWPLSGVSGTEVHAVLCLVAGRQYLGDISVLTRRLVAANAVITALMGLIALVIVRLIARQRRIERQAAEADRLAGLGTLAAGFAHELRNPLGIVRAYTEDLAHNLRRDSAEDAQESCREIVEEIDRMNRLVGQFLSFARIDDARRHKAGDPARGEDDSESGALAIVRSVIQMARPAAEARGVKLEIRTAESDAAVGWCAAIPPGELRQVLLNLVLNAVEATSAEGEVRAELTASSRHLMIAVEDEGPGVDAAIASRIFEPFFSTRSSGSGLGLAISRQLAVAAGGSLTLERAGGGGVGARFELQLPRAKDRTATRAAAAPAAPTPLVSPTPIDPEGTPR